MIFNIKPTPHCMFTTCSLYVHYMFTTYSLYIHYILTIYSLYVHYMFTICSLYIYYIFTIDSLYTICALLYFQGKIGTIPLISLEKWQLSLVLTLMFRLFLPKTWLSHKHKNYIFELGSNRVVIFEIVNMVAI